jgi:hypothetical protein
MSNTDYCRSIMVNIPAQEAYRKIFDVDKWWTKNIEGPSTTLNDAFVINYGKDMHYSKHQLIEAIPNQRIVWLVAESKLNWIPNEKEEWTGTKLVFDIAAGGDKTTVTFTHEGLGPAKECFIDCSKGWDLFIGEHLFKYLEEGLAMAQQK